MAQNNSSVLRGFLDEVVNQKRMELFPKYISEKFIGHGTPYVGMGVQSDDTSGDKVIVKTVMPGGPADGKLMVGDEILRVVDGKNTWKTYADLHQGLWGLGVLGSTFSVWVKRDKAEKEIKIVRGLVQGFEFPYQMVEDGNREFFKEWPDLKVSLVNVIESGDLVAYHAVNQGHNVRYDRTAMWAECGFVRVKDGKITDWWSTEDGISLYKQLGYTILLPEMAKA